ncbi:MAG: hydrogenase nickel incorporation protein HypB [Clostridia bacterium]|jgi:hydrogenase nickel incorporation protein HypB|nr:hydrogenase nickel incorporation protein HypB [Clostridia bacterium]
MEQIKVVEIKEDICSRNNEQAQSIKDELKKKKVFFLNVMSSPGSGKTTLLVNLINRLKKDFRIGVIEADIDSDVDAYTVSEATGVKVIQIHTAGACHLTCQMSYEALCALGLDGLDFVILENIGNLVCPAEFDTGAAANMVLLSVPEGEDKPLKYPLMFEVADLVVVTKSDVQPAFDFSLERARENVGMRKTGVPVFFTSAIKDEGVDALENYLRKEINDYISR